MSSVFDVYATTVVIRIFAIRRWRMFYNIEVEKDPLQI